MKSQNNSTGLKVMFLLIFAVAMISIASASEIPIYKQNTPVSLTFACIASDGSACDVSSSCNLSIWYPNSSILIHNNATISLGAGDYAFNLNTNQTSTNGLYTTKSSCCTPSGCMTNPDGSYLVNPTGDELNLSKTLLYLLVIIVLLGLTIFFVYGVFNANSASWLTLYISLAYWMLWFTFFMFWNFSASYLYEIPVLTTVFSVVCIVFGWGYLPFILLFLGYLLLKQMEATDVKGYVDAGYTKEQAQSMLKK